MKKLFYILTTVILGTLAISSVPKANAQESEAQEFSITIYGEATQETAVVSHRNDQYYKVAIPSFLKLGEIDRVVGQHLVIDQTTYVEFSGDNNPFTPSSTFGFLGAYSRNEWNNENMSNINTSSYFSGDLPHSFQLEYYQNEKVIYEITENAQSASLNYFYVLKDAIKTAPSTPSRATDELISAEYIFKSTNVGDTAYFEGYDAGYDVGYNEGLAMGADNAKASTWEFDDQNNLVIIANDGTKTKLGHGAYDEAFNQGVASDNNYGFGWITALLGAFGSIFAIELLPHLTIGLIVGIPIGFRLVLGIIRIIRGG